MQDKTGARSLLIGLSPLWPRIEAVLGDGGYLSGPLAKWLKEESGWELKIVKRMPGSFKVLPKRWIAERTFAWFTMSRRLAKDYEYAVQSSESMLEIAMIRIMLRRLAEK